MNTYTSDRKDTQQFQQMAHLGKKKGICEEYKKFSIVSVTFYFFN